MAHFRAKSGQVQAEIQIPGFKLYHYRTFFTRIVIERRGIFRSMRVHF